MNVLPSLSRLMKDGRNPTLEEVAEEALVSRATAYRYFSGIEALLVEAARVERHGFTASELARAKEDLLRGMDDPSQRLI